MTAILCSWVQTLTIESWKTPYFCLTPFVHCCVHPYVTKFTCTTSKQLDLDASIFANTCQSARQIRLADCLRNRQRPRHSFSRSKDSNRVIWDVHTRLSLKRRQIWQTLLLPTRRKSHVLSRWSHLHLTLAHSKGQGQGHAHFDW